MPDYELPGTCFSVNKQASQKGHYEILGQGKPVIRKAVVATPATLVKNWQAEIRKWLGDERLASIALQPGPEASSEVCI